MKKRILLVSDVKGWGGWVRGQYIQKHLSDEFDIDLIDMDEFNIIEESIPKTYDLMYLLFHTMLVTQKVRRIISKIKTITIVTGFPTIKPIFRKRYQKVNYTTFHTHSKNCYAIGANNLISLDDLKKNYNGRTFYTPRGVDPDVFYPMSKKPKKENEDLVVAYVGKPVPQKGLNDIIKPACKIANCKLIINDRNYTNALGPDDMRLFYNKADVYLVASTIDGTPNPAIEAAACGKPIISNPIGNMPEFITNWENGFLIKQDMEDKNMIIQKYVYCLKRLKENKQECFDMGMNARQEILNNWTWEKVTENERKIFREIFKWDIEK